MLTREQLDHLCILTALELSETEKQNLLPQLSTILEFVGQLDMYKINADDFVALADQPSTTELPATPRWTDDFLRNVHHQLKKQMPVLQTGLKK